MLTIREIIEFVETETGSNNINADTDIFDDGTVGDDFHDLIDKYAKKYDVNMTNYLWYFHCDEEGTSIGGAFFDPPYKRVNRIPVTPFMLLKFANTGKWNIDYPKHKLPEKRFDIGINQVLALIFIIVVILYFVYN